MAMLFKEDILVEANMWLCMRERGKLVPGSIRDGHNAFTVTGKNWLSKLVAWSTVGPTDIPSPTGGCAGLASVRAANLKLQRSPLW